MINYVFITICVIFATGLVHDNEYTENTVFYEVPDSTGTIHLFTELNEGSVYCYRHLDMEELVLKP